MKYLTTFVVAAVLAFVMVGCDGGHDPSNAAPAYVGTWVNLTNNGHGPPGPPGKIVVTADSMAFYDYDTDTTPLSTGSFAVQDSWDSGGDHYFKGTAVLGPPVNGTIYFLIRVSNSNNTLESTGSPTDYPTSLSGRPDSIFTRR